MRSQCCYPGPEGPPGRRGTTGGSTGGIGPTGSTGFTEGFTGFTGYTGFTGQTGQTGSTGFGQAGQTGQTGSTGQTGQTGSTGQTGVAPLGQSGIPGINGSVGNRGQTGPTGVGQTGGLGQTGQLGHAGLGQTGVSGSTGSGGQTGGVGQTGITGNTGILTFPTNTLFVSPTWLGEVGAPVAPLFNTVQAAANYAVGTLAASSANPVEVVIYPGLAYGPVAISSDGVYFTGANGNGAVEITSFNWTGMAVSSQLQLARLHISDLTITTPATTGSACTFAASDCIFGNTCIVTPQTTGDTVVFNSCVIAPTGGDSFTVGGVGVVTLDGGYAGVGSITANTGSVVMNSFNQSRIGGIYSSVTVNAAPSSLIVNNSTIGNVTASSANAVVNLNKTTILGTLSVSSTAHVAIQNCNIVGLATFDGGTTTGSHNTWGNLSAFNAVITSDDSVWNATEFFASGSATVIQANNSVINLLGSAPTQSFSIKSLTVRNTTINYPLAATVNLSVSNMFFADGLKVYAPNSTVFNFAADGFIFQANGVMLYGPGSAMSLTIQTPGQMNNSYIIAMSLNAFVTTTTAQMNNSVISVGSNGNNTFTVAGDLDFNDSRINGSIAISSGTANLNGSVITENFTATGGSGTAAATQAVNTFFGGVVTFNNGNTFAGSGCVFNNAITVGSSTTCNFIAPGSYITDSLTVASGSTVNVDHAPFMGALTASGASIIRANHCYWQPTENGTSITLTGGSNLTSNHSIFECGTGFGGTDGVTLSIDPTSSLVADHSTWNNLGVLATFAGVTGPMYADASNFTLVDPLTLGAVGAPSLRTNNSIWDASAVPTDQPITNNVTRWLCSNSTFFGSTGLATSVVKTGTGKINLCGSLMGGPGAGPSIPIAAGTGIADQHLTYYAQTLTTGLGVITFPAPQNDTNYEIAATVEATTLGTITQLTPIVISSKTVHGFSYDVPVFVSSGSTIVGGLSILRRQSGI